MSESVCLSKTLWTPYIKNQWREFHPILVTHVFLLVHMLVRFWSQKVKDHGHSRWMNNIWRRPIEFPDKEISCWLCCPGSSLAARLLSPKIFCMVAELKWVIHLSAEWQKLFVNKTIDQQCHLKACLHLMASVIFILIYFLVLVLVFQLFFSFSFVLVLQYFFVLVLVLPVIF